MHIIKSDREYHTKIIYHGMDIEKYHRPKMSDPMFVDTEEEDIPQPVSNDDSINQLTLELLLNHTHYRKYLSKANPSEYDQRKKQMELLELYEPHISQLFADLMQNTIEGDIHDVVPNQEIREAFDHFIEVSISHYQQCPWETRTKTVSLPLDDQEDEAEKPYEPYQEDITHFRVKKTQPAVEPLQLDAIHEPSVIRFPSPPLLRRHTNHSTPSFAFPSPEDTSASSPYFSPIQPPHRSKLTPFHTLKTYYHSNTKSKS